MMKLYAVVFVALVAIAGGFRFVPPSALRLQNSHPALWMSDDEMPAKAAAVSKPTPVSNKVDLVPVDKVNVENAATATGGILGFVLGGPVLAAVFAAVSNYVAKKDGEAGDAFRGLGKTVVESYNYLTNLNSKYSIGNKVGDSLSKAVSSLDTDSDVVETIKKTVTTTTSKLDKLNKEYDLVTKGKEVLVAAGTLSEAALDQVVELNKKYDFVATAKKAASTAAEKIKESANQN